MKQRLKDVLSIRRSTWILHDL